MKNVVGTVPHLPFSWNWMTAPVPAERLAAWRISVGVVLLLDTLLFYWPQFGLLYGPQSLAGPNVFETRFTWPRCNWSVLNWLPLNEGPWICVWAWIAVAVALIVGWRPRLAALIAWALSLSFYNTNFYLHNSGDRIRHFLLLLLIFVPTDAVWSVRRRPKQLVGAVYISGWPIRLMLFQMCLMYFMNGLYKMQGRMWWEGSVMWYVNHDLVWARWSPIPVPYWITQGLTWSALLWEVGFPLWLMLNRTRNAALVIGVFFHLITFFHLEIAAFPLYAICLYVPLAPWERWIGRRNAVGVMNPT